MTAGALRLLAKLPMMPALDCDGLNTRTEGWGTVNMADATTVKRQRPLSPHLQIYKPQITSVMSILHRATGIALSVGLIPLAIWLAAGAAGPEAYDVVAGFFGSIIGVVMLIGWSFCLFYHLLNGIRHLLWDAGRGLSLPHVSASGLAVFFGAGALTALSVIAGFVYW